MQVTTETINGRKVTVIRRPFDPEWVKEQLVMGVPVVVEWDGKIYFVYDINKRLNGTRLAVGSYDEGNYGGVMAERIKHTITILAPLPSRPKLSDLGILHKYYSEDIIVSGEHIGDNKLQFSRDVCGGELFSLIEQGYDVEVYGGHLTYGQRVEIAIEGDNNA